MLHTNKKIALKISSILHVSFLGLLLLISIVKGCSFRKEPPLFILEEINTPIPATNNHLNKIEEKKANITFTSPKTPDKAANSPTPTKKESPKLTKITHSEFLKHQKKTQKNPEKNSATRTINTASINSKLQSLTQSVTTNTASSSLLNNYIYNIKRIIDSLWEKPKGTPAGLEATLEFTIEPNGIISKSIITKPSGSSIFDKSILETIQKVGRLEIPPDQKAYTFQLTFKSIEGI